MSPAAVLASVAILSLAVACKKEAAPAPVASPSAPAPAAAPVVPAPAAPPAPAPAPPPADDRSRFAAFDRANLAKHQALVAFFRKLRGQLDDAGAKLKGKKGGPAKVEKLQDAQGKLIAAQAEALHALDPEGNRSYITGDHDTVLHFLADEYPAALVGDLSGDPAPLAEVRAEMDRIVGKIEAWLVELSQAPR